MTKPRESLSTRLNKIGATAIDCGGAGDCCPNSIAYFINMTGAEVREVGAEYLKSNEKLFEGYRHAENDSKAFARPGTYVDGEVEIRSIVEGLAEKGDRIVVGIVCADKDHDKVFISKSETLESKSRWVFLGYDIEGEHFVALKQRKHQPFLCSKSKIVTADSNQIRDDDRWIALTSRFARMTKEVVEEQKRHLEKPKSPSPILEIDLIKVIRLLSNIKSYFKPK